MARVRRQQAPARRLERNQRGDPQGGLRAAGPGVRIARRRRRSRFRRRPTPAASSSACSERAAAIPTSSSSAWIDPTRSPLPSRSSIARCRSRSRRSASARSTSPTCRGRSSSVWTPRDRPARRAFSPATFSSRRTTRTSPTRRRSWRFSTRARPTIRSRSSCRDKAGAAKKADVKVLMTPRVIGMGDQTLLANRIVVDLRNRLASSPKRRRRAGDPAQPRGRAHPAGIVERRAGRAAASAAAGRPWGWQRHGSVPAGPLCRQAWQPGRRRNRAQGSRRDPTAC